MGSRKKIEFLRCMLCNGMNVGMPSEIRGNKKAKISKRR